MAQIKNQRAVPIVLIVVAGLFVAARVASVRFKPDEKPKTTARAPNAVKWVDIAKAEEISRKTGKSILYDFTAEWCGPCHRLDDEVFENPALAARINEQYVPVRVVDRRREDGTNTPPVQLLQNKFGVRGFPTIVIADAGGRLKDKVVGYRGVAGFEEMMGRTR